MTKKKSNVKRHSVFRRFERRAQRLRASLLGAAVGSWPYYSLASAAATALPTPAGQCTKTQTWAWVGGGGSSQTTRQQAAAWCGGKQKLFLSHVCDWRVTVTLPTPHCEQMTKNVKRYLQSHVICYLFDVLWNSLFEKSGSGLPEFKIPAYLPQPN